MTQLPSVQYSSIDYETIEAAVVETERGRWFLSEYQRRNRHADTQQVLGAIERMQVSLVETVAENVARSLPQPTPEKTADPAIAVLRQDLIEMARRIADTHTEVAAVGSQDHDPKHIDLVSGELDAIVRSTEQATSEILEAAEQIQEIAWTLREGGLAVETCDAVDARATNIYLACSFQDLTAQRTHKVIETMRFLENRIHKMINILQGVEGFQISDLPPEALPQIDPASPFEGGDTSLAQNDVDFALEWVNEQKGEVSGQFVDAFTTFAAENQNQNLLTDEFLSDNEVFFSDDSSAAAPPPSTGAALSEQDITDTLEPLDTAPAPALSANVVLLPDVSQKPEPAYQIPAERMSQLEALDEAELNKKLSLFT
ncbi:MAG: protein phosphatase CheZ [Beijerinckiaceae bacterium]|nr:protein phosphatase CheZ [Beijerinckiaceae bacterium]